MIIGDASERLRIRAESLDGSVMQDGSQFVVRDGAIRRIVWAGAAEPILLQHGRDLRIKEIARGILGVTSANHLINQVHYKLLNDGVFFPFHQDSRHRRYGTHEWTDVNGRGSYVQVVVAIDEVTSENGPLLFIPGSCRKGHLDLPYDENSLTVSDKFDVRDAVAFGLYTIHGSSPNNSAMPRRVFINGFAHPGDGAGELVSLL